MDSHLTPQNIALGVAYLRNSRAITCDIRLDGNILRRNLLRPELISTSLEGVRLTRVNIREVCGRGGLVTPLCNAFNSITENCMCRPLMC